MRKLWLITCVLFFSGAAIAADTEEVQYVTVADPFIEFHTGPGPGYPVTHVVERGEEIGILKRRTDWFKVRDAKGKEGWVFADQLAKTLQPSGETVVVPVYGFEEFQARRWEAGVTGGDFDGSTSLSVYGGYRMSKHLGLEAEYTELFGDYSDGWVASINVTHTFVPEWRVSPFFC